MEAVSVANDTQDLPLPDDDPGSLGYHDYDPNGGAMPPALPTLVFEGVNFPEDPIKLLSVQ
ncbi:neuropeptide Y receptor type 2-like protein, partial [Lates japonicus]